MSTSAPGWYPDPWQPGGQRWFDGTAWTPAVQPPPPSAPPLSAPPTSSPYEVLPSHEGDDQLDGPGRAGRPRWPLAVAALVVVLALVSGALFAVNRGSNSSAAPPTASGGPSRSGSTGPAAPKPQAGDCHAYSEAGLEAPTDPLPPVPCSGASAVAVTVAVLPPPAGVRLPFDNDPPGSQRVGDACQQAVDGYVGQGDAVLFSRLTTAFFEPTAAQIAAGQSWVRCDVVMTDLDAAGDPVPATLPSGGVKGALEPAPPLDLALCVARTSSATSLAREAGCRTAGALVAVSGDSWSTTTVPYPGAAVARQKADALCRSLSAAYGGRLPLTGVPQPELTWSTDVVCVATVPDYQRWLAAGSPFTGRPASPTPGGGGTII